MIINKNLYKIKKNYLISHHTHTISQRQGHLLYQLLNNSIYFMLLPKPILSLPLYPILTGKPHLLHPPLHVTIPIYLFQPDLCNEIIQSQYILVDLIQLHAPLTLT